MRSIAIWLLVLAAPASRQGRKIAFLVGVGQYTHLASAEQLGLPPVNDVKDMSKILHEAEFEIVMLTDEKATKQKILNQLDLVLKGRGEAAMKKKKKLTAADTPLGKDDLLLFQFSGHGFQGKLDNKLQPLLVAHDSSTSDTKTMVAFNEVLDQIAKTQVKAVCLIDACRNELGKQGGIQGQHVQVPKGVSIFFSCQEGQRSQQDARFGHGLFTKAIIDVCRGRRNLKENQVLTWDALVSDVKENFEKGDMKKRLGSIKQSPHTSQGEVGVVNLLTITKEFKFKIPAAGTVRTLKIAEGVTMDFCWIPKGKATLGSPETEEGRDASEEEQHPYSTSGFWMGRYPVTQKQWTAVRGDAPFHYCKLSKDRVLAVQLILKNIDTSDFPAENVTWQDCRRYVQDLQKLSGASELFGSTGTFVMPTADDWEYACRGGHTDGRPFYWGHQLAGDKANMNGTVPYGTNRKGQFLGRPCKVGEFETAAPHPWKLCDMIGNVWQWCDNEDVDDTKMRVMHGGSWSAHGRRCRSASKNAMPATEDEINVGVARLFRE